MKYEDVLKIFEKWRGEQKLHSNGNRIWHIATISCFTFAGWTYLAEKELWFVSLVVMIIGAGFGGMIEGGNKKYQDYLESKTEFFADLALNIKETFKDKAYILIVNVETIPETCDEHKC